MISGFNIQSLTNFDNQYWRIDWFGYLSYEDASGQRRSEPLVDIYLSPFRERPAPDCLNYKYSTDLKQTNVVKVPVSYLRVLRLGDVWYQGRRIPLTHSDRMREKLNVTINSESAYTATAGAKGKLDDFLLPFTHHPYHGKATKVHCEFVKLDDEKLLIFPHYTLLQAYFSRSQYVFQQLFKFGLQFDSIYDPSQSYITDEGDAFILLKKWTHDVAAPEVARLAFDEVAAKAVRGLSENLSLQSVNDRPISPKIKFPFEGETTLEVFGKWCPLTSGRKVFIVYDILSCNAAYPFSSLDYFRDNHGGKEPLAGTSKGNKKEEAQKKGKSKPVSTEDDCIDMQPENEPRRDTEELLVEGRAGTIFNDLTGKRIDKKRLKAHLEAQEGATYQPYVDSLVGGNTGDGDRHGITTPVDFQLPHSEFEGKFIFKDPICRLDLFQKVIDELKHIPYITSAEYMSIFPELGYQKSCASFFPTTYTDTGRKSTWQYINYFKGFTKSGKEKYHRRRALIAKLGMSSGLDIFLIEAERRKHKIQNGWVELDDTSIFLSITHSAATYTNYELATCLTKSTEERGKWQAFPQERSIKCTPIKHPHHTTISSGDYVRRQVAIIERHINAQTSGKTNSSEGNNGR
ncbi:MULTISPECIES: hypothetical protein [Pseudoalteromonas]|uniref:TnsE C-terminal domain-containing protein n=1 Tax=Pseudoalteromonas amylolytica TaxID=1859457 RepID=A0A1S1MUU0_9GAMM|nr:MULTISPECIES: hypothetical protein [Pseudoalteromonas]OHU90830.1 hypothetical protein BFC16_04325 [Pseudoalteromonas sp. JW3]OHU92550.1 hypothetical protein BET10_03565 [Pseudoalteromonas amylolytica]